MGLFIFKIWFIGAPIEAFHLAKWSSFLFSLFNIETKNFEGGRCAQPQVVPFWSEPPSCASFPFFSRQLILLIVTSRLSRDGAISPQDKEGKKSAQVNALFYAELQNVNLFTQIISVQLNLPQEKARKLQEVFDILSTKWA